MKYADEILSVKILTKVTFEHFLDVTLFSNMTLNQRLGNTEAVIGKIFKFLKETNKTNAVTFMLHKVNKYLEKKPLQRNQNLTIFNNL